MGKEKWPTQACSKHLVAPEGREKENRNICEVQIVPKMVLYLLIQTEEVSVLYKIIV